MTPELLATHQIISLFEKSKGLADQIFDNLSGVALNFDKNGIILRANKSLASDIRLEHEDLLGVHISTLFAEKRRGEFTAQLQLFSDGQHETVEFELPLALQDGTARDYLWQISPMKLSGSAHNDQIYTCIGRDVSEVKAALAKVVTLAKDLELAEAVQNLLLPSARDMQAQGVDLATFYKPAAIAGGDFWSFDFISENKIWVLVGDVTGHGAGSAMVTALVSGCIRTLKNVARSGDIQIDLPMVINSINQNLVSIRNQPYWMTLSALEVDLENDSVAVWEAGTRAIFSIPAEGKPNLVSDSSRPLGAGECMLASGKFPFFKGHRLFIFTDGIAELANSTGSQFGNARLSRFLEKNRNLSATALRDELLKVLDTWRGEVAANDDITFVILDRQ